MLCHSTPHISQYLKQELWSDSSISPLPTHGHGECWTVQHSRTVCTFKSCGVTPPFLRFLHTATANVEHSSTFQDCVYLWNNQFQVRIIDYEQFIINLNSDPCRFSFKYIYTLHVFYWLWTVHNQSEFSIHADTGVSCRSDERSAHICSSSLIVLDIIVCNIAKVVCW